MVILRMCRFCLFFNAKEDTASELKGDLLHTRGAVPSGGRMSRHFRTPDFGRGQASRRLKY